MHGMGHGMGLGGGYKARLREERKKARLRDIKRSDLQFIIPHLKRQGWLILFAIIVTALMAGTNILAPLFSKILIDDYVMRGDIQGIISMSSLLIAIHAFNWLFSYLQHYSTVKVAQHVIKDVRRTIYEKILALSLRFNNERKK